MRSLRRKLFLTIKVVPFAIGALGLKLALHRLGWDVVSLNPLFSGLLAAAVFLLGFFISGVLADYKESEKLPVELAASLETLFDEGASSASGRGATSFVSQGYTIAALMAIVLSVGLLFTKMEPFYESLFFTSMIPFLLAYMLRLIKDLDDPLEYGEGGSPDEISLAPLDDAVARMRRRLEALS